MSRRKRVGIHRAIALNNPLSQSGKILLAVAGVAAVGGVAYGIYYYATKPAAKLAAPSAALQLV